MGKGSISVRGNSSIGSRVRDSTSVRNVRSSLWMMPCAGGGASGKNQTKEFYRKASLEIGEL